MLFDLNGTLVDTEVAFFKAYQEVLARYGVPFKIETFTAHWSTQGKKLHDFLIEIDREDLLPRESAILVEKDRIFQTNLEATAILMPYAKETVERVRQAGIKIGLDSSTHRENIDKLLKLFDLTGKFEAITSRDTKLDEARFGEQKHKSSRLKALADMLGYQPAECVVIGDAAKDIKGAKEAGMKAIAVPNQYTRDNDFSLADKVVDSLQDLTLDTLSDLFPRMI